MGNSIKRIINQIPGEILNTIQVCYSERILFVMPLREKGGCDLSQVDGDYRPGVRAEVMGLPLHISKKNARELLLDGISVVNRYREEGSNTVVIMVEERFLRDVCFLVYPEYRVMSAAIPIILDSSIISQINIFNEEYRNRQSGSEYVLRSLDYQILVSLLRSINGNREDYHVKNGINKAKDTEKENITRAIKYLKKHVTGEFSLKQVSKVANLSPYHFIRVFKAYTGKTPYDYFLDIKILKAREFLSQQNKSVTEVCYLCGFNNLSHFTALFKKRVGLSPSEYRKNLIKR